MRQTVAHSGRTFVFLCQVYVPDPAAVGQHVADAASELARRGHRVVVYTADRGYEDPARHFPRRELLNGVIVVRLPFSSFGKGSLFRRMLAGASFALQSAMRVAIMRHVDAVVVSTVPPLISFSALAVRAVRRVRLTFWVMDLNPDQAIAVGIVRPDALSVRALEWSVRMLLRRADDIVVLDRFMAERVAGKGQVNGQLTVIPPWPLDDHLAIVPHAGNPFRKSHGLEGRFVVMYSGNHSPANPIDTLVEAARAMQHDDRVIFMFVGGGKDKRKVEESGLANVRSLPYQTLHELKYSLSAADLHVVTIGNAVVGMVHPCKVYGAMAVARAIIVFGPNQSHVADILRNHDIGWQVQHGDVQGAVAAIREAVEKSPELLAAMGQRACMLVQESLTKRVLCGRFCDVVERRLLCGG